MSFSLLFSPRLSGRIIFVAAFFLFMTGNVYAQVTCIKCQGTGDCPTCNGTGIIRYGDCHGQPKAYGCESCGGISGDCNSGKKGTGDCSYCNGTGKTSGPSLLQEDQVAKAKKDAEDKANAKAAADAKKNKDKEKEKKSTLDRMGSGSSGLRNAQADEKNNKPLQNELKKENTTEKKAAVTNYSQPKEANPQFLAIKKKVSQIEIPPLSEEQIHEIKIEKDIEGIREKQHKEEKWIREADILVDGFDLISTVNPLLTLKFKGAVITAKSIIADMNEAEILVFRQNALYEKTLLILDDKIQGPKLLSLIKTLREHKPVDGDFDPELLKYANAILSPELGNSGLHITLNAMLSKEAINAGLTIAIIDIGKVAAEQISGHVGKDLYDRVPFLTALSNKADETAALIAAEKSVNVTGLEYLSDEIKFIGKKIIAGAGEKVPVGGFDLIWDYETDQRDHEHHPE